MRGGFLAENGVLEVAKCIGEFFELAFQEVFAALLTTLFFGVVFVGFELVLTKESVENGAAFLCGDVFAGFLQIFAISHVANLKVHEEIFEGINE